ncbi:MAG: pyruvate ferredoxin oxidoreductase subunit gamma [Desulfobacterota bacterium]|nr:pyruvate ferredoxin oxidoreductase subunit gamma [Thermodesulfobacteriota bacterium]
MLEIRLHGRGGQGAVTSAELVAAAVINEGRYAQAFPSFGPERRGAPVKAFIRIASEPIRLRNEVEEPDVVLVLDPTLTSVVNVGEGLKGGGLVIVNTSKTPAEVKQEYRLHGRVATVNATKIATETIGRPIANTTMIGALVKATGALALESLREVFIHRFGKLGEKNFASCRRAYEETQVEGR